MGFAFAPTVTHTTTSRVSSSVSTRCSTFIRPNDFARIRPSVSVTVMKAVVSSTYPGYVPPGSDSGVVKSTQPGYTPPPPSRVVESTNPGYPLPLPPPRDSGVVESTHPGYSPFLAPGVVKSTFPGYGLPPDSGAVIVESTYPGYTPGVVRSTVPGYPAQPPPGSGIVKSTYPGYSPPDLDSGVVKSTYPGYTPPPISSVVESTQPGYSAPPDSGVVESTVPGYSPAPVSSVVESTHPGYSAHPPAESGVVRSTFPGYPSAPPVPSVVASTYPGYVPSPPPVATPTGNVATLSPPAGVFDAAVALGTSKAEKSVLAIILMGIAAGAYIAIGCMMSLAIGGSSPALQAANPGLSKFIFGFVGQPWGLFMVLCTGAELFTGNSMLMTAAALRRKAPWRAVLAKWGLVFAANCVGALGVVWLSLRSQVVSAAAASYVAALATAKVSVPWGVAFLRGIGCNWIVCVGVLAATGSRDLVGKFFAALAVVSMFVSLGFDQCIANMFFLPLGLACGSDITWKSIIMSNIIPVTLGNIVGGAILVGMVYHLVNVKKAPAK